MEPTMIVLDHGISNPETLEGWRKHLHRLVDKDATEDGKFPHRLGSTGLAMEHDAINRIFDLAKKSLNSRKRHGKVAKAMAADYLREMADQLSPSTSGDESNA